MTNTWTTRDGKVIPIRQLDDDHLRNIHRMLLRIAYVKKQTALSQIGIYGEPDSELVAFDVYSQEVRHLEEGFLGQFADPRYEAIAAEIKRRKLYDVEDAEIAYEEELEYERKQAST